MTPELITKMNELIQVLTPPVFYKNWAFCNTVILAITLCILIRYAFDTYRLANQAKETNLRPIILRYGFIKNWESIKYTFEGDNLQQGELLHFSILKNVATNIHGYIIKDGIRYNLRFGNDIAKVGDSIFFNKQWGWMNSNTSIHAFFKEEDGEKSQKSNQIVIMYKDIEGNPYYTIENERFDHKSFKGII